MTSRRRAIVSLGVLLVGVVAVVALVMWQKWLQDGSDVPRRETPGVVVAPERAAERPTPQPLPDGGDPGSLADPAVAVQTAAPEPVTPAPRTTGPSPTAVDPTPPSTPAPTLSGEGTTGGAGSLTVVVQGGTGLVHLDAPGWVDRYAPLSAAEVPAGRWAIQVRHADAAPLWSGVVEIPADGTVGVLLEPGPEGGWKATVK